MIYLNENADVNFGLEKKYELQLPKHKSAHPDQKENMDDNLINVIWPLSYSANSSFDLLFIRAF